MASWQMEYPGVVIVDDSAPPRRGLLVAVAEGIIYIYLAGAAFIYYIPHLPVIDVSPINVISILLYVIAALMSFQSRRAGFLAAALVYWVVIGTALLSSINNDGMEVFHEVCVLLTFLAILIITGTAKVRTPLRVWAQRIVFLGILQGLVAIGIFWTWIPAPEQTGIHAFNGERTGYIIDGMFGLLAEVGGFWNLSIGRISRLTWFSSFAAVVLGIANSVLSGYRSYTVAAAFLFVAFVAWTIKNRNWRLALAQAAMIIALLVAAVIDPTDRIEWMHQRIVGVQDYDSSLIWRKIEFEQERYVIRGSPWAGDGWGLAKRMRVSYLGDMPSFGHNLYTAFPARIGIPTTIYLLCSWVGIAVIAIRKSRHTTDLEMRAACWYTVALTLMVLAVSAAQNVAVMSRAFPLLALFFTPVIARPALPVAEADAVDYLPMIAPDEA